MSHPKKALPHTLSVRLGAHDLEKLERLASATARSKSNVIRRLIAQAQCTAPDVRLRGRSGPRRTAKRGA